MVRGEEEATRDEQAEAVILEGCSAIKQGELRLPLSDLNPGRNNMNLQSEVFEAPDCTQDHPGASSIHCLIEPVTRSDSRQEAATTPCPLSQGYKYLALLPRSVKFFVLCHRYRYQI